jgi:hypothetical protein
MKLLFASSDVSRVEVVRRNLAAAGVACEVRLDGVAGRAGEIPYYPELWVKHERDFMRATQLLIHGNAGR